MSTKGSKIRNPFEKILKKKPDVKPIVKPDTKAQLKDIVYEYLESDSDEEVDVPKDVEQPKVEEASVKSNQKSIIKEVKSKQVIKLRDSKQPAIETTKKYKLIDPEIAATPQELPTPILPKYQRVYGSDGDYLERKHALKKRKMNNENKIVLDNNKYILSIDTHKAIPNYTDTELTERHNKADKNLANSWKNIISKYENLAKDESLSDVVDLKTGRIIVDNGHLKGLNQQDTLKRTEDRNYNVLGRVKNSYDDDFLDLLSSEHVINEAKKKNIDVMDLKERGILKGLNLNLELTMSDLDTDEESEGDNDESFHLSSEEEHLSEAESIESESDSDIEVDDEIEESLDSE